MMMMMMFLLRGHFPPSELICCIRSIIVFVINITIIVIDATTILGHRLCHLRRMSRMPTVRIRDDLPGDTGTKSVNITYGCIEIGR